MRWSFISPKWVCMLYFFEKPYVRNHLKIHNYASLLLLNQLLVTRSYNSLLSLDETETNEAHTLNIRCGMSGIFSVRSDWTRVMKSTNSIFQVAL